MGKTPLRILHVIGGMSRGGPETWLMRILRHIDRQRFQMDFVVHTTEKCPYDQEVQALGGRIIPCLQPHNPFIYARNFKRILKNYGPYDIVHSHVQYYSGFIVRLAYQAGVPIRIAHNHTPTYGNIDALDQHKYGILRRGYIALMRNWISRYATLGLIVNRAGGPDMFGSNWESDPRFRILHYGIDLTLFRSEIDSKAIRRGLGIPADAFVVGNVSRFFRKKNHPFILEIFSQLTRLEPRLLLLLVGDGPLQKDIEDQAARMGLTPQVIFTGSRPDVPDLMRGAMDVFLFPSFSEGLPNVMLEAQAAGLPCVFSDDMAAEVDIISPLIHRMSLSQPASEWADAVRAVKNPSDRIAQEEALEIFDGSPFDLLWGLKELERAYHSRPGEGLPKL